MGNVVKWRIPEEVTTTQRKPSSSSKLLRMPETIPREQQPQPMHKLDVIEGKYVAIDDPRTGKHTLAFKDTKSPITRESVIDLVETSKRYNRVANFVCADLNGLNLIGIEFGHAIFRYAHVTKTKFDIAGIYEADLDGAIFNKQQPAVYHQSFISRQFMALKSHFRRST